MKKSLLLLLSSLFILSVNAQQLVRKGSLGAIIQPNESGKGILLQKVLEGSTAAQVGLVDGDILLKVNGQAFNETQKLVALTQTWRQNDQLEVKVSRAGEVMDLSGMVKGKPMETSPFGEVVYGEIPFQGGLLRSILSLPKGIEKPPVLFYIQGYPCASIDYYHSPKNPQQQLTAGLLQEGIAVFKIEKPGMGDSENEVHCLDAGFEYELAAFETALKHLKRLKSIDSDQIFLFGHSLGGTTAPLIAAKTPVKGIISFGAGISKSWYEYMIDIIRDQQAIFGDDYEKIEKDYRLRQPLLYDYMVNKLTPQELEQNPAYKNHLSDGLPLRDGDLMIDRYYTFWQEINEVNFPKAWKAANTQVMAIHGEFDIHAINPNWAKRTADMVNSYHPGKGEWMVLPKTEHGFAYIESMEAYLDLREKGQYNSAFFVENFNPKLVEVVKDFIQDKG